MRVYNYKEWMSEMDESSQTVPDQSYSVQEIIERFTRGQSLPCLELGEDDDQNLSDEEMMNLEPVDDWDLRQLAIDFEEAQEYPRDGKAARHPSTLQSAQDAVKAPESREISPVTESSDSSAMQSSGSQQVVN